LGISKIFSFQRSFWFEGSQKLFWSWDHEISLFYFLWRKNFIFKDTESGNLYKKFSKDLSDSNSSIQISFRTLFVCYGDLLIFDWLKKILLKNLLNFTKKKSERIFWELSIRKISFSIEGHGWFFGRWKNFFAKKMIFKFVFKLDILNSWLCLNTWTKPFRRKTEFYSMIEYFNWYYWIEPSRYLFYLRFFCVINFLKLSIHK